MIGLTRRHISIGQMEFMNGGLSVDEPCDSLHREGKQTSSPLSFHAILINHVSRRDKLQFIIYIYISMLMVLERLLEDDCH